MLLRRLSFRYAVAAPIFVFAAWLFVTGALGPSPDPRHALKTRDAAVAGLAPSLCERQRLGLRIARAAVRPAAPSYTAGVPEWRNW